MPNWVSNGLTIKGTESELTEFSKILKYTREGKTDADILSFHSTVPLPESESENWYNWQIANWGTKWDACEIEGEGLPFRKYEHSKEFLLGYGFNTAWSMPSEWLVTTSKAYPSLTFNNVWTEEQGFQGVLRAKAGEVVLCESKDTPQLEDFYIHAKKHNIEIPEGFDEGDAWDFDEYNEWYNEECYSYPKHWEEV